MNDNPKMSLPDNMGRIGDVIGDCAKCGKHNWGPQRKKGAPFVCNKCATGNPVFKCDGCGKEVESLVLANWGAGQKCMVCKECLDTKAWYNSTVPEPISQHYTKLAIDPYEYAHRNGLGMLQGNVVKYVTRYKDKNGKEDLEKAINTLKRLIELEYPG